MCEKFDEVLTELGTGKWNLIYFISSSLIYLLFVPLSMSSPFVIPPLNHTCTEPTPAVSVTNSTKRDQCFVNVLNDDGDLEITKCTAWEYDNSTFSSTATSEFDMVCDNAFKRGLFLSIKGFGSLLGDPISGFLCDSLGRKKPSSIFVAVTIVVSIAMCWVPDINVILACRFLIGVTAPIATHGLYTLTMEVCEPKYRSTVGIVVAMPWALGVMAWGGIGYLIRDWRWLLFSTALPFALFIPIIFLWDESPRWLVVKGRHKEALKILQKAARWNKSNPVLKKSYSLSDITESVMVLFRTPEIRKTFLLACLDFMVTTLVYVGLSLYGMVLKVNTYLYMTITGLMEVPAYGLAARVVATFGRRGPSVVGFFVSAVSLLSVPFIPQEIGWLVIVMTMIGKFCISGVFMILYLYFTELFPTEVRGRGLGTAFLMSNTAGIVVPFIVDILGSWVPWVPSVIFGISTTAAGIGTMFLRETLHQPLYETVSSLERDTRIRRMRSKKADPKTAEEEIQLQA
ncbi:solute carrier family 22 member 20-like [Oratosquilla oratoria]|uniref:solute carrier family 22 member 20-like n=1 Tax=Oratosquilla oratoria TaxID=337810 RepID=UPI003F76F952